MSGRAEIVITVKHDRHAIGFGVGAKAETVVDEYMYVVGDREVALVKAAQLLEEAADLCHDIATDAAEASR